MEDIQPEQTTHPTNRTKRVRFTEDTKFEDGGRSSYTYHRSNHNPDYEPGPHSASERHTFRDTSFAHDSHFSCGQIRVFIGTLDEVNTLSQSYQMPTRNEGILTLHPRRSEMIALLDDLYKDDEERFFQDIKGSDWLLAVMEGDKLVEVSFYETWDIEEEDMADDLVMEFHASDGEESVGITRAATATKRSAEENVESEDPKRMRLE